MSAPTMRSTSLLTEHLEYPPISLIDDIINAVNEIMYKCTHAMEKYLLERNEIDGVDYTTEIKVGTAKLESLLENAVDKNFDKLELYVLRNVLNVPQNLLDSNAFRLKHHSDLVLGDDLQRETQMQELSSTMEKIEEVFKLNQVLQSRLKETRKLQAKVVKFKQLMIQLLDCKLNSEESTVQMLKSLKPVDDTIKLLMSQLRGLYLENEEYCSLDQVRAITTRYEQLKDTTVSRTGYINRQSEQTLGSLFPGEPSTEDVDMNAPVSTEEFTQPQISHPDWSSIQKFT